MSLVAYVWQLKIHCSLVVCPIRSFWFASSGNCPMVYSLLHRQIMACMHGWNGFEKQIRHTVTHTVQYFLELEKCLLSRA